MAEFRTRIPEKKFPFHISHQDHILCMGSCFAAHMGSRLGDFRFHQLLNPFGILYNPVSIAQAIGRLQDDKQLTSGDLFQHQGLWHSHQHHSRFSGTDAQQVLLQINTELEQAGAFLQKTNRLIITLGTAYVFVHQESQQVVANCHKLPASQFKRQLLSTQDCILALSQMLEQIKAIRPKLEVILSVSPIRHLRDGHIQNQRSKATLLLAAAQLESQFDFVHYFPAYEIMMDDLRDYRFYESDFIHPSQQAIDYIWAYFKETVFDEATRQLIDELSKIIQASRHRPFHIASAAHQLFLQQQIKKISALKEQYSFLDLDQLKATFGQQLV